MAHLFPGDADEHGAVILCGAAEHKGKTTLLARELILAVDGVDYVPGTRGYRHLKGEFVTHQIRRAKDLGLAYIAVHNHGGHDSVSFSDPDLASHERAYPTLTKLSSRPVGALVCALNAVAGDIWHPDGSRSSVGATTIIGSAKVVLTPEPVRQTGDLRDQFDRQALLFGSTGQSELSASTVVVVGCGGVGMLLIEYLARLGVGRLVVVDPDVVEPSNLPRLPGASRLDAMAHIDRDGIPEWMRAQVRRLAKPKVRVARRIARRANHAVELVSIRGDIADDAVAQCLRGADFVFLAADTMLARDVVNQYAYQYLVPTLQVGSKVVVAPTSGDVTDVFAVVRHVGFGPGCMRCNGLIDPVGLSEESLADAAQAERQRYVDDPDVAVPSVITLNSTGASFAANDFMLSTVGLGGAQPAHRVLRNRPVGQMGIHVTTMDPDPSPGCPVCSTSEGSTFARGDAMDLPTRI